MSLTIEWQGDEKLERALQKASNESVEVVGKVLQNYAEKAKAKAKQIAPRDTWFMHDHIVTIHRTLESDVHSQAGYSGFVEFGTRYMSAQPFMRPAIAFVEPMMISDMLKAAKGLFNS